MSERDAPVSDTFAGCYSHHGKMSETNIAKQTCGVQRSTTPKHIFHCVWLQVMQRISLENICSRRMWVPLVNEPARRGNVAQRTEKREGQPDEIPSYPSVKTGIV